MLDSHGIAYRYREYRDEPLSASELHAILKELDLRPNEILRTRDRAFRDLELHGDEPEDRLIALMSRHPTLIQRPIGRLQDRAVIGRPPERLLELLDRTP